MTNIDSAEVLDEVVTRSRGEIRHACSPKIRSRTQSPQQQMKSVYSPRSTSSSHMQEIRMEISRQSNGQGLETKQTPSPGSSMLGHGSSST